MPLVKGSSREAISKNIDELTHNGSRPRPHDQIVAIALSQADKSKREHRAMGGGGLSSVIPGIQNDSYHPGGLLASDVAGRTDRLPHAVAADSFVIPASEVATLGQGNTLAGAKIMDGILSTGPYGTTLPRSRRAGGGNSTADDGGISHVMVAGGEYIIPRNKVQELGRRLRAGGKSKARTDLAAGHDYLRDFVMKIRKHEINRLKNAPSPKK